MIVDGSRDFSRPRKIAQLAQDVRATELVRLVQEAICPIVVGDNDRF